jgi:hypothetical protein
VPLGARSADPSQTNTKSEKQRAQKNYPAIPSWASHHAYVASLLKMDRYDFADVIFIPVCGHFGELPFLPFGEAISPLAIWERS